MKYTLTTNYFGKRTLSASNMTEHEIPIAEDRLYFEAEAYTPVDTLVQIFINSVNINEELNKICHAESEDHDCDHSFEVELPYVLFNHCLTLSEQLQQIAFEPQKFGLKDEQTDIVKPLRDWSYEWLDGQNVLHQQTDQPNKFDLLYTTEFWKTWHYRRITNDWLRDGLALFMTWTAAGRPGDVQRHQ